jgi:hypothetical protein
MRIQRIMLPLCLDILPGLEAGIPPQAERSRR